MKLYYFYTLKALWDSQGKIKMYYGMSRVKKQLSGKRSITKCTFFHINYFSWPLFIAHLFQYYFIHPNCCVHQSWLWLFLCAHQVMIITVLDLSLFSFLQESTILKKYWSIETEKGHVFNDIKNTYFSLSTKTSFTFFWAFQEIQRISYSRST